MFFNHALHQPLQMSFAPLDVLLRKEGACTQCTEKTERTLPDNGDISYWITDRLM